MNKVLSAMLTFVAAATLLIFSQTPAFAAQFAADSYFVSPHGNDNNPGTESQPWRTLEKAGNSAQAGHTVYFMEGVYPGKLQPRHSGTEGSPITFTAYPGHTAIIDGGKKSKGPYGGVVDIDRKQHLIVSNLQIINAEHFGVRVENSDHILILNNLTDFTYSSGVYVAASRQIIVDGNEIRRACHGEGGKSPQEHISVRGGTDGFEIRNNYVHSLNNGNGKEGINVKEGAANGKVYNNVVDGMRRTGLYVDGYNSYVRNVEIFNNVVTNSLHGIVIVAEHRGVVENISVYNNVFHSNQNHGIWIANYLDGGPVSNLRIVNNTIYNNVKLGIHVKNHEATNVLVRNNIVLNNGEGAINIDRGMPPVTADHNMVTGDAMFVNPAAGDFRLQPGSPAINTGNAGDAPLFDFAGGARPSGSSHDLGAFELDHSGSAHQHVPQTPQQPANTDTFQPPDGLAIYLPVINR